MAHSLRKGLRRAMTRCFLDMDGVIADFVGAIHIAHNRPYCYAIEANRGKFDIEPLWGITTKEFWSTDSYDFWRTVEPTVEADKIVATLESIFGTENIAILTSPSNGPGCVPGKRDWMKKFFPQFRKQMIFTSAKQFLADEKKLLIDDKDVNVENFRQWGGHAILIPRHWNSRHADSERVIEVLHEGLGR